MHRKLPTRFRDIAIEENIGVCPSLHLFTKLTGKQGIDPVEALEIVESCERLVVKLYERKNASESDTRQHVARMDD
jgi:hypothetical protein